MKPVKWIIVATVVAAVAGGSWYFYQSSSTKTAVVIKTVGIERGDIVSTVAATGTIKAVNSVDISSKITGLIRELNVQENDTVKAGQVLIVLDDTRLQAQVSQKREQLNNAATDYERNRKLSSIGAVSDQQFDKSRVDYKVAQASYDDAMSQLNDTVIVSPIDGVVIGKPIPAGQTVAQGISNPMVILTVADMSQMQIETLIDESDIGKVKVGQKAIFTVDAYPGKKFIGTVTKISQKATVQQNVVYYGVFLDVDGDDEMLKPSMTARVSVSIGESKGVLTLPLSAIKTQNGKQYVVVQREGGKTESVSVKTGLSGEDRVEVVGDVKEGDQVILTQIKAAAPAQQPGGATMPRLPR